MTYKEQRDKEINRLYATGNYSYKQLAKKFSLSTATVGKICKDDSRVEVERKKKENIFKEVKQIPEKPSKNRKFNRVELVTNLIESMADFADAYDWDDDLLISILLELGIARRDFELAGYGEFARYYFEGKVVLWDIDSIAQDSLEEF